MWRLMAMPSWHARLPPPPRACACPRAGLMHAPLLAACLQVDHLSTLGVDVAHRLGYDDINESLCVKEIVHGALAVAVVARRQRGGP